MDFEIRLAETGHSEILYLQQSAQGETLINHISNVYKISPKDQFLLTKIGHRISPEVKLKKVLTEQRNDKTMMGKDYTKMSHQRISCIYLYNLKEITKPAEQPESKFKQYWLKQLEEELKQINNLRPAITSYDSLASIYPSESLQSFPKAVQMVNSVRNSFINLENQYIELKQIHAKNEQLMERCEKQRKSSDILSHYISGMAKSIKDKVNEMHAKKEAFKKNLVVDDKSLRQNSGYFEIKKKQQNTIVTIEGKLNELKGNISSRLDELKQDIRGAKAKYHPVSQKMIDYGNFPILKKVEEKSTAFVNEYNKILNNFRLLIDTQDYKYNTNIQNILNSIEKSYLERQSKQYESLLKSMTNYYCEFSQFNEKNRFIVRENYQNVIKWKEALGSLESELNEQAKILLELTKSDSKPLQEVSFSQKNSCQAEQPSFFSAGSQKSLESFKISIKTEAQIKRRVKFYKKLNYLQSFADKTCAEEQNFRKKYLNESKNVSQNRQLLKNIKVPVLDIDFNGTSDIELFKMNKASSMGDVDLSLSAQEFMLLEYHRVVQKINKISGLEVNNKMKNLQEILKSVSDIFYKIYHKKYQEMDSKIESLNGQFKVLEGKNKNLEQDISKHKKTIQRLEQTVKEKEASITALQATKNGEIVKEKSKYDKILYDKRSLESDLKKQMKLTEELYNQVTLGDQDLESIRQQCEELKLILAEKEIQIIKLEQEISQKTKNFSSVDLESSNKDITDFKSLVVQNLSQKIAAESANHSELIDQLKKENSLLQNYNDIFQEQIESLSSELRKIIMKDTEEQEIQVDSLSESVQLKSDNIDSIRIGEDICVGQSSIFMPFNNRFYVGVCSRDEDRTLCNMNNHQSHYILDIDSFSTKTRELLSQCSFLVVLKVQNIKKDTNNFSVEGKIEYLLGFEDDNLTVKNYASFLS